MAKLYFRYAAMGAGKSIDLLKVAYNYEERMQRVLVFTSAIDSRNGIGFVSTRVGLKREAILIDKDTEIFNIVKNENDKRFVSCILVDEAQFLSKQNIYELSNIVDELNIPVMCYGLRTDFRNELFEGSSALLAIADSIEELKTICKCGRKATQNIRLIDGKPVVEGEQVFIGGNETYTSVCRKCYKKAVKEGKI